MILVSFKEIQTTSHMKDYKSYTKRINELKNHDCFANAMESDILYLKTLKISDEIIDFYQENNPRDIIEINGIRLLPISEIMEENSNYTPGYILSPKGYYVIASTIYGDVYCIYFKNNELSISIASHDEIDDETENLKDKTIVITNSFSDFLERFIEGNLVRGYYDLEQ